MLLLKFSVTHCFQLFLSIMSIFGQQRALQPQPDDDIDALFAEAERILTTTDKTEQPTTNDIRFVQGQAQVRAETSVGARAILQGAANRLTDAAGRLWDTQQCWSDLRSLFASVLSLQGCTADWNCGVSRRQS